VPLDGETATLPEEIGSASDALRNHTGGTSQRLEFAAAGLLGVQAVQIGRHAFSAPKVVKAMGEQRNGKWVRGESGAAGAQEVMLDRRARSRPASAQRLAPGAIDATAQKWLDSGLGIHPTVETSDYKPSARSKISIDWGKRVKPLGGQEKK
jgi:hypothetical protein